MTIEQMHAEAADMKARHSRMEETYLRMSSFRDRIGKHINYTLDQVHNQGHVLETASIAHDFTALYESVPRPWPGPSIDDAVPNLEKIAGGE